MNFLHSWITIFSALTLGNTALFAQVRHLPVAEKVITENTTNMISALRSDSILATVSYSQGIKVDMGVAFLIFIAGQVAIDKKGNIVGEGDIRKQTEQVFINIKHIVAEAGGSISDVVKMTVFLTDMANAGIVREIRNKYINRKRPPTSSILQVVGLFRPEYLLEIEAIAIIPKR